MVSVLDSGRPAPYRIGALGVDPLAVARLGWQMPRVFISYRRDDSLPHAGRLYDGLTARFGEDQIFMDIDTIEPGADFVAVIESTIARCDAMVAVIGKRWISATDADGRRRLDNPNDYVRLEVAAGLRRGVRLIPVLVDGATMPHPSELPRALQRLARRNALEFDDRRWRNDLARLSHTLEKPLDAVEPPADVPVTQSLPPLAPKRAERAAGPPAEAASVVAGRAPGRADEIDATRRRTAIRKVALVAGAAAALVVLGGGLFLLGGGSASSTFGTGSERVASPVAVTSPQPAAVANRLAASPVASGSPSRAVAASPATAASPPAKPASAASPPAKPATAASPGGGVAAGPSPSPAAIGRLLRSDDFSDPARRLFPNGQQGTDRIVVNGTPAEYQWRFEYRDGVLQGRISGDAPASTNPAEPGFLSRFLGAIDRVFEDFACEVRGRIVGSPTQARFGMRYIATQDARYTFTVYPSAETYTVSYIEGQQPSRTLSSGRVTMLRAPAEDNVLRIEVRGDTARVFINGQQVDRVTHAGLAMRGGGGALGLVATGPIPEREVEVRFDDFKLFSVSP